MSLKEEIGIELPEPTAFPLLNVIWYKVDIWRRNHGNAYPSVIILNVSDYEELLVEMYQYCNLMGRGNSLDEEPQTLWNAYVKVDAILKNKNITLL